jgi:DNA topoisomerase-1
LEEKGIGRPSTFASLVDKIQERKYVLKENITGQQIENVDFSLSQNTINELISKREFGNEKNKLVIQPLGIIVIEFLLDKFEMFFNYQYTGTMEQELDLIANGKHDWIKTCEKCYTELTNKLDLLQDIKKFSLVIDDEHSLIIGKHGPVIKCVSKKEPKKVSFLPVKKNLDLEDLKYIPNLTLEHVMDNNLNSDSNKTIGRYRGQDLFIKKGKYGIYAQWGKETRSLKEEFSSVPLDKINYIDIIKFLDKDTVLDPKKPVGFIRELNGNLSIRTGKYGDYVFYKKPRAKTPQFFKLNGFDSDYKKCDKAIILNWIKQTYNVE